MRNGCFVRGRPLGVPNEKRVRNGRNAIKVSYGGNLRRPPARVRRGKQLDRQTDRGPTASHPREREMTRLTTKITDIEIRLPPPHLSLGTSQVAAQQRV